MIEYVDRLLKHWAQELSVSQTTAGLGYRGAWMDIGRNKGEMGLVASCSDGFVSAGGSASRGSPGHGGIGKVAEQVDQAVQRLSEREREVVTVCYRYTEKTQAEKAKSLRISTKTMYRVLDRAHQSISADLPDTYAGWRGLRLGQRGKL